MQISAVVEWANIVRKNGSIKTHGRIEVCLVGEEPCFDLLHKVIDVKMGENKLNPDSSRRVNSIRNYVEPNPTLANFTSRWVRSILDWLKIGYI